MNLWLSTLFSISIHVLVNPVTVTSHAIRHQAHRNRNHTHPLIMEQSEHQRLLMSMSTGGCKDGADCLSPALPLMDPHQQVFHTLQPLNLPSSDIIMNPNSTMRTTSRSSRQARTSSPQNESKKCSQQREELLRISTLVKPGQMTEYIPTCRKDGSYAQVQCHLQTKSCWCATRGGRHITGSSLLLNDPQDKRRPNCAKYLGQGKSQTQRRASLGKNNRKSCNYADRSRFNVALIRTFKSEYNRYKSISSSYFDSEGVNDEVVLSWKFDSLDRNRDGLLYKNETLILKHLVKQQIQPRACAKNFISFCAKGDQKIIKREWLDCLRLPSTDRSSPSGIHPSQLLKPGDGSGGGGESSFNPLRPGGGIIDMQETSNCRTDRQSALASQIRNESVIIPECTINGLYSKVQCAQGKTYCWCVEEDSGIQILNTVVVNSIPDCNNRYSKPMKGCSGQKKQKFIADLLDTLIKKMTTSINEGRTRLPLDQRQLSVQEQSARWYFNQLDLNRNTILERNEWKNFRNEVSRDKRLKKCGKKLPRHCDVNGDRRLTVGEWVDCLGVELFTSKAITNSSAQPGHHGHRRPVHRSNGRRNGKNPFTNILKQR